METSDCLFCRIVAGEVPSDEVAATERTYAFRDIKPALPVHVLIVPREHIASADAVTPDHADVLAAFLRASGTGLVSVGIATLVAGALVVAQTVRRPAPSRNAPVG